MKVGCNSACIPWCSRMNWHGTWCGEPARPRCRCLVSMDALAPRFMASCAPPGCWHAVAGRGGWPPAAFHGPERPPRSKRRFSLRNRSKAANPNNATKRNDFVLVPVVLLRRTLPGCSSATVRTQTRPPARLRRPEARARAASVSRLPPPWVPARRARPPPARSDAGAPSCPAAQLPPLPPKRYLESNHLNRARFWLHAGNHSILFYKEPKKKVRNCAYFHARDSELPLKAGSYVGAL